MLNTTVERLEGSAVKLTVTIPAEEVDAAVEKAYKTIGGKMRVPGFRPGKAPKPIIDRQVGRDNVLAEATEELVNSTYPRALDAENLRPLEPPEMEGLDTVEPGQAYTYEAQIEVRPEMTVSSVSDFEIALPPKEATDEDVQEQVDAVRERFATLEPVEDRGLEQGDFALLSFVGTVEGEAYEGNVVDKYLYELGRGLMPKEFDEGILGAKPGEERVVEFTIPDTTSNPDFAGKTARFEITVHEVKAKALPEENDELAENVGGFDSMEAMRENIRQRVNLQKSNYWNQLKERSARELLASRLEGDVPEVMVKTRREQLERDFATMLEQRQMTIEDYLANTGIDPERLTKDLEEQAAQSVREELALEALFREKGMEVTDADIDEEIAEISKTSETSPEETRSRWEKLGLMAVVREQIMHRKAMQWVLDNVTITEEQPETESESAATGTKKPATKKRASRAKKQDKPAESGEAAETEE